MSSDPLLDGQPISQLKVVDLRRELERFGLPKAGNKKDLFDRLRDHLNSQEGGDQEAAADSNEAETIRPSTRSSASPRKTSPTKTPTKSQSPTKVPQNRFVAQYLQNQQASLEENRRGVLRASAEKSEEPTEKVKEVPPVVEKEIEKASDVETAPEISPPVEKAPVVEKVPESIPVVTKADVIAAIGIPGVDRDENSSTISNAGSENAPQTIPDDGSMEVEKNADESTEATVAEEPPKTKSPTKSPEKSPVKAKSPIKSPEKSPVKAESPIKSPIKSESPKKASPVKEQESSSSSSSESSSESEEDERKTDESETKKEETQRKQEGRIPAVAPIEEPSGVELDYEEEEPIQAPKTVSSAVKQEVNAEEPAVSESQKSKTSTPPETAKKHRAIVFDLNENTERKSSDSPAPKSTRTTVSIRPNVTAVPPKEKPEYGTNSLGNVRLRPVSPSRREPTQYIHVTGLKRPYVLARLQAVLRTFGEFNNEDFWIDDLRSNCMVKYNSVEEATKAREEMHNIQWPDAIEAPMINADYTTEEGYQRRRGEPSQRKSSGSGLIIRVSNDRKSSADEKADSGSVKSDESRKRKTSPRPRNNTALEELFRKTKAKPHIYYLPLTEEQIAAKKQRLQK